ncbi:hypothetical protein CEUSTIGMA_g6567.t1 [Chlamydomonas eustigma]|uniref:Uncharacterized protein n=1 Tax=Chlamydomonas eustigma TaxID=1157962 RepID=A0A250X7T7_9CHLO|nr:hypothetical protein CEUSTIGMA_g6567.t1 [Chlamydomonas eustigma]|eukprot:GAX79127.1 hypothetical protein CEUSTIGMA_g6567.t1 [Chlamydomonas eustigma]
MSCFGFRSVGSCYWGQNMSYVTCVGLPSFLKNGMQLIREHNSLDVSRKSFKFSCDYKSSCAVQRISDHVKPLKALGESKQSESTCNSKSISKSGNPRNLRGNNDGTKAPASQTKRGRQSPEAVDEIRRDCVAPLNANAWEDDSFGYPNKVPAAEDLQHLKAAELGAVAGRAVDAGLIMPTDWMEAYVAATRLCRMKGLSLDMYIQILKFVTLSAEAAALQQQQERLWYQQDDEELEDGYNWLSRSPLPGEVEEAVNSMDMSSSSSTQVLVPPVGFGFFPAPSWVRGLLVDALPSLTGACVADINTVFGFLLQLNIKVTKEWMVEVYSLSKPLLATASFNDIASLLCSCVEHHVPPHSWLEEAAHYLERKNMQPYGGLGLQLYSQLLGTFLRLQFTPGKKVQTALEQTGRRLLKVSCVEAAVRDSSSTLSSSLISSNVGTPSGSQSRKKDTKASARPSEQRLDSGASIGTGIAGGEPVVSLDNFQSREAADGEEASHEDGFQIEERSVVSAAEVMTAESLGRIAKVTSSLDWPDISSTFKDDCVTAYMDFVLKRQISPNAVYELTNRVLQPQQDPGLTSSSIDSFRYGHDRKDGARWKDLRECVSITASNSGCGGIEPTPAELAIVGATMQACEKAMPHFESHQLASVISAVAESSFSPPMSWESSFYKAAAQRNRLSRMNVSTIAGILRGLVTLGWHPPREWTTTATRSVNASLKAGYMMGQHVPPVLVFLAGQTKSWSPSTSEDDGMMSLPAVSVYTNHYSTTYSSGGSSTAVHYSTTYSSGGSSTADGASSGRQQDASSSWVLPHVGPPFLRSMEEILFEGIIMDMTIWEYAPAFAALIRLGHVPEDDSWGTLTAESSHQFMKQEAPGRALVLLLLSHAMALIAPPDAWVEGLLLGLGRTYKSLAAADWAAVMWSLGTVAADWVPREWTMRAAPLALGCMTDMEGDEMCVTLWGLAMLGYKLEAASADLQNLVYHLHNAVDSMGDAFLGQFVASFATLSSDIVTNDKVREVEDLLNAVERRCERQGLPQDAGALLELLLGFQMLQYSPGPGFLKAHMQATGYLTADFSDEEIALLRQTYAWFMDIS